MGLLPGEKEVIQGAAESLGESADADPRSRWIMGVFFAVAPALAGIIVLLRTSLQYWQFPSLARELLGNFAWGAGLVTVAAFMHFHFYWSPDPKYHVVGWLGKILAAGLLVVILLAMVFHGFVAS